jgi:signal transduction histidine kinase
MNSFLLSSFSLMALIIMLTALLFFIALLRNKDDSDYKKWMLFYFAGLLIWHGMGFLSGGLHSQMRELTYRYTNTSFNLGLVITCVSFIQIAYLFPQTGFERERKIVLYLSVILSLVYFSSIVWYHFLRDQSGASSATYGGFVNVRAGMYTMAMIAWTSVVFFRKARFFKERKSKNLIPARVLGLAALLTLFTSLLFIYPGTDNPLVLPVYIYSVWIFIQAQVLVFIIYAVFPVRFQTKLVGFTFASIMAILTVTIMSIVSFTTNSDDPVNMAQRITDQPVLFKMMLVIIGSTIFILWIFPIILRASLVQPLQRLLAGIQKADQGDLEVQVPEGMQDEIGILTRNFNAMVYSLKTSKEKLTEYANTLEQQVAERTTELSNSLKDLKATQSQLIHAEKMASLGELTAGIAHEIQNPLNFVNNFSDVSNELLGELAEELEQGNYEEVKAIATDVQQNMEKILHHGKRADAIVKGMLQHSRSSSGTKEPADINAMAEEFLRLAYHGLRAKDKSFNASFFLHPDLGTPKINVVRQDIGRVFLNLVNNAFYAVHEKDKMLKSSSGASDYVPSVSVTTMFIQPSAGKTSSLEIRVKDNGNGIPADVVAKIFQPFFTTKPAGEGTGLGLSLSYDIVKAHGGELKVETKEGEGSTFFMLLPFV